MEEVLRQTDFHFPNQTDFYRGKVRDVYYFGDKMALIATDRISAFDFILPRAIPYKGQVLNQIASKCLKDTADIVPNWLESVPDPNVSIGKKCKPFPIEMVIRGYLTGHAWREYSSGKRMICGVAMPEGMKENEKFPEPIITPATKATEGHDEDISREGIITQGLVNEDQYKVLEDLTYKLFQRGTYLANERGLILVDTKYEFGQIDGEIYIIDEVHTPDSSRYFYKDDYKIRQQTGEPQKHLSKEFTRQWLISEGFQGLEGQTMPAMPDEKVEEISARYIELYEQFIGEPLKKENSKPINERIRENILTWIRNVDKKN